MTNIDIIKEQVKRLFHNCDQNDLDTHFELGRRLHIRDYYYAREYFQHTDKYVRAVELLVSSILSVYSNINETTFICSGNYADQFINKVIHVIKAVKQDASLKINYAIIDHSHETLSFYFEPAEIYKRIVIILPITCTYKTALKIKPLIIDLIKKQKRNGEEITIDENVFCVFLIYDERLNEIVDENYFFGKNSCTINVEVDELYSSFQWQHWDKGTVTFLGDEPGDVYKGHSVVKLPSKLYLPEKCEKCFPAKNMENNEDDDLLNETCLLPTRSNNDTPNLIYGLPRFANNLGSFGPISNKDNKYISEPIHNGIFDVKFDDAHLYGHLQFNKNSYLHYIKRDKFYDNNKGAIVDFFRHETADLWENWKECDRLLIVTLKHNRTSGFLSDFIYDLSQKNINVTLLVIDPFNEYLENLQIEYNESSPYHKVLFFDYIISGAKVFKAILDRLNILNNNNGIDRLLVIIDRTTQDSKTEILQTNESNANYFAAFIKLNVPLMNATHSGNPIKEKVQTLHEILKECHLDALKLDIGSEIIYGAAKSIDELERHYSNDLVIREVDKVKYLAKLKISHLISSFFLRKYNDQTYNKVDVPPFRISELKEMICEIQQVKGLLFPNNSEISDLDKDMVVEDIVVKTLSRSPFKIYQGIYQTVFNFSIEKMNVLVNEITDRPDEKMRRRFKFYVKRIVEINSNYILSYKFLAKLRQIFVVIPDDSDNQSLLNVKYFILKCFKELIYKNNTRSIKLEESINNGTLIPDPVRHPHKYTLRTAIQDEFYQLARIIKTENIHLLSELKETFLKDIIAGRLNLEDDNIRKIIISNYLFRSNKNQHPSIRLFIEFLQFSRLQNLEGKQISKNVVLMLETVYLLERENKDKEHFLDEVKRILDSACGIISTGFVGEDKLDYGFFIEYKNRYSKIEFGKDDDSLFADNIYSIISNSAEEIQPKILKNGFIYNMLYGLSNNKEGKPDVQTFIAIAKGNDGEIYSFRDKYYSLVDESYIEIFPQSIVEDYKNDNRGSEIFENAKIILLFRLADISYNKLFNAYTDRGRAVFAICYPKSIFNSSGKTEVEALTEFLHVERVRLLLLIKNQLLEYLRKLFANDAFISLNAQNENIKIKRSMKHGLENYMKAFGYLINNTTIPSMERTQMSIFLQNTIRRHMTSLLDSKEDIIADEQPIALTSIVIKKLFDLIMKIPGIGYKISSYTLDCFVPEGVRCHPAIMEQIIPELIVNMKTYSFDVKGPKHYSIKYEYKALVFSNNYVIQDGVDPLYIKPTGGKAMCNKILDGLRLGKIFQEKTSNLLTVKFNVHG